MNIREQVELDIVKAMSPRMASDIEQVARETILPGQKRIPQLVENRKKYISKYVNDELTRIRFTERSKEVLVFHNEHGPISDYLCP